VLKDKIYGVKITYIFLNRDVGSLVNWNGNSDAPTKAECTFTGKSGFHFLNSCGNLQLSSLCIVYVHTMMHYVVAGQFVH
jgi:hypothetical protein